MKLLEISKRTANIPMMVKLFKAVDAATGNYHDDEEGIASLQFLANTINNPIVAPFLYRGKMYRLIMLDADEDKNTKIDMNMINNYIKNESKVNMFSFSKTIEGVESWEEMGSDPGGPEIHISLAQTGVGFDVQKIYRYVKQFSKEDLEREVGTAELYNVERAGGTRTGVFEVIAPYNETLQITDVETKYESDLYDDEDDYE
jgi:hypothetical protein